VVKFEDTIFALSSAPGRAGVSVIRISGPQSELILRRITNRPTPDPRKAVLRNFIDPENRAELDRGLALWFPQPASFTGEDVVELHVHGGTAVLDAVLSVVSRLSGARPAMAGEFTRRAFELGKLDLTEVEGLADLVAAETEAQRRQALRQMQGKLAQNINAWRGQLIHALAHIEAHIDFSDEDLPEDLLGPVRTNLMSLMSKMHLYLAEAGRGERLRRGLQVAVIGPPNVGKSSLINAIAKRDVAIVSPMAGTTRDIIEVHLDMGGYPVTLADTAGLRDGLDAVEVEGVRRARAVAVEADLKLAMFDASCWPQLDEQTEILVDENTIRLLNKIDLAPHAMRPAVDAGFIVASLTRGEGVPELLAIIQREAIARLGSGETPGLTRTRHRLELEHCAACIQRATRMGAPVELIAEDVRLAVRALGRITGRVDVEDILDIIFADFCVGK